MNLEDWRSYLLSFPASVEEMPFGPEALVYKLEGKMFALLAWTEEPMRLNLKCEPNLALHLRDTYPTHVTAGYHMNKRHWNTVKLADDLDDELVREWVTHSYDLIYTALPKAIRAQLQSQHKPISNP